MEKSVQQSPQRRVGGWPLDHYSTVLSLTPCCEVHCYTQFRYTGCTLLVMFCRCHTGCDRVRVWCMGVTTLRPELCLSCKCNQRRSYSVPWVLCQTYSSFLISRHLYFIGHLMPCVVLCRSFEPVSTICFCLYYSTALTMGSCPCSTSHMKVSLSWRTRMVQPE